MTSNHHAAQHIEAKLLEYYGFDLHVLRAFALDKGCDITIQSDGLWLSRPGLAEAMRIDEPLPSRDWRYQHAPKSFDLHEHPDTAWLWGYPFRDITTAATWLWEQADEPDPSELPTA